MKILFIFIYWLLSLTWGSIMSIIGLLVSLILLIFKGTPHRNGCSFIIEIGGNWGGLNLGCCSFCGRYLDSSPNFYAKTRRHEFGHSLQNIVLGPIFIFLIAIPSVCRYWYKRKKKLSSSWYDSAWFEKQATNVGTKYINWLDN